MSVPVHRWQKLLKKKKKQSTAFPLLSLFRPSSSLPSNSRTAVLSRLLRGAPRFQLLRGSCLCQDVGREGGHSWFTDPI